MSDNRDNQLPACQKCKFRKVRCDRAAPKCSHCTKSNIACIILDPVTGEQYARDFIRQLEAKERELKRRLCDHGVLEEESEGATAITAGAVDNTPPITTRSERLHQELTEQENVGSAGSYSRFVGDGSGLGFLQRILSDAKWQHRRAHILNQLANRSQISKLQLAPHALPPLVEAEQLLHNYLTRSHINRPFLLRRDVLGIFNRIYPPSSSSPNPNIRPSAQDYFRIFMIFAISGTTRYREGLSSEHPYGYYRAAEMYLGSIPLIKDPDAIQNLLLIARFGIYHHIGTSLWEISQLCMRQCIEWSLHTKALNVLDLLTEQHHRRIFWECYVCDRFSSGILGRPFAILESEISVPLPVDSNDEAISASNATSLDQIVAPLVGSPTELSTFIWHTQLRRISSRIHSTFYTGRSQGSQRSTEGIRTSALKSVGYVYASFLRFEKELRAWRDSAPIFPSPDGLYQSPEWHEFLFEKDRLLLARGAMHNIPAQPYAPTTAAKDILDACFTSATRTIELYAELMKQGLITWTRSYFQVIFTAGLTIIYYASLNPLKDGLCMLATGNVSIQDPIGTLNLCSTVLYFFREKMPDAGSFAVVFDVLKDECIKDLPPSPTQHLEHLTNQPSGQSYDYENQDFGMLGFTDDLINQLEAGLGEYAWGSLNMEEFTWDPLDFT